MRTRAKIVTGVRKITGGDWECPCYVRGNDDVGRIIVMFRVLKHIESISRTVLLKLVRLRFCRYVAIGNGSLRNGSLRKDKVMIKKILLALGILSAGSVATAHTLDFIGRDNTIYTLFCREPEILDFVKEKFGNTIEERRIDVIVLAGEGSKGISVFGFGVSMGIPNRFQCAFSSQSRK